LFANVGLTLRGLAVLNAVPDAVTEKRTLGDRVKSVAKFAGQEPASAVIPQLLAFAARFFAG